MTLYKAYFTFYNSSYILRVPAPKQTMETDETIEEEYNNATEVEDLSVYVEEKHDFKNVDDFNLYYFFMFIAVITLLCVVVIKIRRNV